MEEESIQCMIRVKEILDNDFKYKINDEYSEIVQKIENYVIKHCQHKIVFQQEVCKRFFFCHV